MEFVTGVKKKETLELSELLEEGRIGTEVKVNGAIHTIRDMGTIAFIILRKREGLVQCVYEEDISKFDLKDVKEADTVEVTGVLAESAKAPNGIEIRLGELKILSEPAEPMPLPISKWKLNTSLEAKLNYRPISLRNIRERAKFRIQEGIVRGFRDFLYQEGFTEIHTPKIGAKSAEGRANLFRLEYFHRPAILQQSPQFYKQMMVGVFDRVFETAPVFRAEKHNTKRHLNEYTSLDFEMGYIDGFEDIMAMGGHLKIDTGLVVQFHSENAQTEQMQLEENPLTEQVTLKAGNTYTAGTDFPAGWYDVTEASGVDWAELHYKIYLGDFYDKENENLNYENYGLWFYDTDGSESYRNAVFPEGTELEVDDGDLILTPSGSVKPVIMTVSMICTATGRNKLRNL